MLVTGLFLEQGGGVNCTRQKQFCPLCVSRRRKSNKSKMKPIFEENEGGKKKKMLRKEKGVFAMKKVKNLGERRFVMTGGEVRWLSVVTLVRFSCCRGTCCCWCCCCCSKEGRSGGFVLRGGEMSSIRSEFEVLRRFDCFDDGTGKQIIMGTYRINIALKEMNLWQISNFLLAICSREEKNLLR